MILYFNQSRDPGEKHFWRKGCFIKILQFLWFVSILGLRWTYQQWLLHALIIEIDIIDTNYLTFYLCRNIESLINITNNLKENTNLNTNRNISHCQFAYSSNECYIFPLNKYFAKWARFLWLGFYFISLIKDYIHKLIKP